MEYPTDFKSHMLALGQFSKFTDEENTYPEKQQAYATLAVAHALGAIAAAIKEGQGQ
jgi:hypothetical protein